MFVIGAKKASKARLHQNKAKNTPLEITHKPLEGYMSNRYQDKEICPIRLTWLYLFCADLPQLAGALTSSAKDVSPRMPFLDLLGF
jgi:hypothetical protein